MYSVDTTAFLFRREAKLNRKKKQLEAEKERINRMLDHLKIEIGTIIHDKEAAARICDELGEIERVFYENGGLFTVAQIKKLLKINYRYIELRHYRSMKTDKINAIKEEIHKLLADAIEKNAWRQKKVLRELHEYALVDKNVISNFESSMSRILKIDTNELTMDLITVEVFYEEVAQQLINDGFTYKGEKYVFFSASAGQIRTKRTVFIKESVYQKYEDTLTCGLSIDEINALGGINVNKYLAYLSLNCSATDEWVDFDIDKTIVVPDFEAPVHGVVDHVDDETYTVQRKAMDISIEHTDGCGMMLPCVSDRNFMIRMPWVKGLLAVFDFRRFIEEHGCSPVIKDVYGDEHDVIAEDIQVIFTKSQFKMWKYFKDYNSYKYNFKKYHCQAGTCKKEEDDIRDAQINYQMLQTLTNITDRELNRIAEPAVRKIENVTQSLSGMLEIMHATKDYPNKSYLEQAIQICPELLSDTHCKEVLTDLKRKMVNEYRAGKLPVNGKYTFVVPDLYAACEYWFLHEEHPRGILDDGEVFCALYPSVRKLDCLRAPHLYREHAVRKNVVDNMTADWFSTQAIYTSCHDMISRVLQFDNDGDTILVVANPTLIRVAERNMEGVVPLYYEMKKAEPNIIDRSKFYDGMKLAWAGGKIGEPSNNITKIWNEDEIGEDEELAVKLLCLEVNFTIDYAKTLYKPQRPEWADDFIKRYTSKKVPYFFQEAKGKNKYQVSPITESLVNKLREIIVNKRINYHNLAPFDYKLLMNDNSVDYCDEKLADLYNDLAKKYHFKLAHTYDDEDNNVSYIIQKCRERFEELDMNMDDMADQLAYHLFNRRSKKSLFWYCFGDILLERLRNNVDSSTKCCHKCGKRFKPQSNRQVYCDKCAEERKRNAAKLRARKFREKRKYM